MGISKVDKRIGSKRKFYIPPFLLEKISSDKGEVIYKRRDFSNSKWREMKKEG